MTGVRHRIVSALNFTAPMKHPTVKWLLFAVCAVCMPMFVQGCVSGPAIRDPEFEPLYGEIVDSIVVLPYVTADGVKTPLNSSQISLFQEQLITQLETQRNLRLFEEPPTELPNTLVIESRIAEFDVQDRPGKEFFLRSIHMVLQWRFRTGDQKSTSRRISRKYSFQKIYPPDTPIPALDFDLPTSISEITEQLVEIMYPTAIAGAVPLADASDPVLGDSLGHPKLLEGIAMAEEGRFAKAKDLWRLVLFDPTQPEEEELFRVSPRTLALLKQEGVEEDLIRRLRPLTEEDPEDLLDFRNAVRSELGGFHQIEPILLKLAHHHTDTRHLNMAAAHRNLAALYWMESRFDLMSYHLARAYANYPDEEYLEKWTKLQQNRDFIPVEYTNREAIGLYMRLASPRSTWVVPGVAENSLFPPVVFEAPAPPPNTTEGSTTAPVESSKDDEPLKPVKLAPLSAPAEGDSEDLPPVQPPERAGG